MFFWLRLRDLLLSLLPSVLIIAVAGALLTRLDGETELPATWPTYLPLVLLAVSLVLGLVFRQSRLALTAVPCAAAAWRLGSAAVPSQTAAILASFVLPGWFLVCGLTKERRLRSLVGILAVALAAASATAILCADGEPVSEVGRWLTLLHPLPAWSKAWALPSASLAMTIAAALSLTLFARRGNRTFLLQALFFLLVACNAPAPMIAEIAPPPLLRYLALTGAAIVLVWAGLEAAWRQAFLDELTGLPGRRPLTRHLASLAGRYSVAIVDIDHFKRINDSHGHDIGDQVLRFLSAQLRGFGAGEAYRFGGEEFVLVLGRGRPERHLDNLDRLRERIAGRSFELRGSSRPRLRPLRKSRAPSRRSKGIRVTVSIGMATRADNLRRPSDVLQAADKALYQAKRGGRNRVAVAKA